MYFSLSRRSALVPLLFFTLNPSTLSALPSTLKFADDAISGPALSVRDTTNLSVTNLGVPPDPFITNNANNIIRIFKYKSPVFHPNLVLEFLNRAHQHLDTITRGHPEGEGIPGDDFLYRRLIFDFSAQPQPICVSVFPSPEGHETSVTKNDVEVVLQALGDWMRAGGSGGVPTAQTKLTEVESIVYQRAFGGFGGDQVGFPCSVPLVLNSLWASATQGQTVMIPKSKGLNFTTVIGKSLAKGGLSSVLGPLDPLSQSELNATVADSTNATTLLQAINAVVGGNAYLAHQPSGNGDLNLTAAVEAFINNGGTLGTFTNLTGASSGSSGTIASTSAVLSDLILNGLNLATALAPVAGTLPPNGWWENINSQFLLNTLYGPRQGTVTGASTTVPNNVASGTAAAGESLTIGTGQKEFASS